MNNFAKDSRNEKPERDKFSPPNKERDKQMQNKIVWLFNGFISFF